MTSRRSQVPREVVRCTKDDVWSFPALHPSPTTKPRLELVSSFPDQADLLPVSLGQTSSLPPIYPILSSVTGSCLQYDLKGNFTQNNIIAKPIDLSLTLH